MAANEVGTAFIKVVANTDDLEAGIQQAAKRAGGSAGSAISSDIGKAMSGIGGKVGSALGEVVGKIKSSGIGTAFSGLAAGVKGIGGALGTVTSAFSAIGAVAGPAVKGIGSALGGIAGRIGDVVSGMASKVGGALSGAMDMAGKAAGVIGAGLAAATAAVGKSAVDAYGNFEQLQGGLQLAFGDDVWASVEASSQEAFKNVQMSQNDYLSQVQSMAVGLREAMGGDAQAAADLADRVITTQADVVSALGVSQDAAQNAFNGIMKGNFQMLDNLGLGIKPTKEGFQEVIDKMNEWNATQEDRTATNYNIDNLADCQAALADYVEYLGYSGYAAKEGSKTIQGSVSKMKGAWTDWVGELGKSDGDMGRVTDNLVESIGDVASNVVPVMGRIGSALVSAVPQLAERVASKLDETIAGGLAGRAVGFVESTVGSLADSLGTFLSGIDLNAVMELASTVGNVLGGAIDVATSALSAAAPVMADVANTVMPALASGVQFAADVLHGIWDAATGFGGTLAEHLQPAIETLSPYLSGMGDALSAAGGIVTDHVLPVFVSLADIVGGLLGDAVSWVSTKFDELMQFMAPVGDFFGGIADGIGNAWGDLERKLGIGADSVESSTSQVAEAASAQAEQASSAWDDMRAQYDSSIAGMGDAIGSEMASASESIGDEAAAGGELAAKAFDEATVSAGDAFGKFEDSASKELGRVVSDTQNAMAQVRAAIPSTLNFPSFTRPYIALPHFTISGQFDAKSGSVPSVGVSWFGKGGIAKDATLFGYGDSGAELLWPSYAPYLDKYADAIADHMEVGRGGDTYIIEKVEYLPDSQMARYTRGLFTEAKRIERM